MIKETSYSYGKKHQEVMLEYYYRSKEESDDNTDYLRVKLAKELVTKYALPHFEKKIKNDIQLVDVGCSVGLMAIEFAKLGYNTIGYDFDTEAIKIADELKKKENVDVRFKVKDISNSSFDEKIDIAVCFDMFEHLHDDELGVLLYNLKKGLSKDGCIVFHTLPTEYDYLFWDNALKKIKFSGLLNFLKKSDKVKFEKAVKISALINDIKLIYKNNITYKETIKKSGHPNPLSLQRLKDIFERSGFIIEYIESGFLSDSQLDIKDKKYFYKHQISHRSIYGVLRRKK